MLLSKNTIDEKIFGERYKGQISRSFVRISVMVVFTHAHIESRNVLISPTQL
jgi:hypothetical protein